MALMSAAVTSLPLSEKAIEQPIEVDGVGEDQDVEWQDSAIFEELGHERQRYAVSREVQHGRRHKQECGGAHDPVQPYLVPARRDGENEDDDAQGQWLHLRSFVLRFNQLQSLDLCLYATEQHRSDELQIDAISGDSLVQHLLQLVAQLAQVRLGNAAFRRSQPLVHELVSAYMYGAMNDSS